MLRLNNIKNFLKLYPDVFVVFEVDSNNYDTVGTTDLKYVDRAIGFITSKENTFDSGTIRYTLEEYEPILAKELFKLRRRINRNPNGLFFLTQMGLDPDSDNSLYLKLIRPALIELKNQYDSRVVLVEATSKLKES